MKFQQHPGIKPKQKTGHGLPKGMTSPLNQVKVEAPKDVKSGRKRVDVNVTAQGDIPGYSMNVFENSAYHESAQEHGAVIATLNPGKFNSPWRTPNLTGLTKEQSNARKIRNNKQELKERADGTYFNKDGSLTQWPKDKVSE